MQDLPKEFYIVTADFGREGFGSVGDARVLMDDAYNQYAEARQDGQTVQATLVNTLKGSAIDVTHVFENTLRDICKARDLPLPEAA